MKNWMIIALCVCLVVSITACSQHNDVKEPEILQSQSIMENPSTPPEQEPEASVPILYLSRVTLEKYIESDATEKLKDAYSVWAENLSITPGYEWEPYYAEYDLTGDGVDDYIFAAHFKDTERGNVFYVQAVISQIDEGFGLPIDIAELTQNELTVWESVSNGLHDISFPESDNDIVFSYDGYAYRPN